MSVQQQIEAVLGEALNPEFLDVANESHMHSVPLNSETHFRVVLVSEAFVDQRKVARHQRVYGLLARQLEGPVHALALQLYTPHEWCEREREIRSSPDCMGGSQQEGAP
ncbi:MAG: BolA family protein [Parahaliea sp.]